MQQYEEPMENVIDEKVEKFFQNFDWQIIQLVKEVERKIDSVRKEREGVISIIGEIVKQSYNGYSQYGLSNNGFVGVKMYGSMASNLAIDSSDVDLSVTGIDFKGNRELLIKEMRSLYEKLEFLKL